MKKYIAIFLLAFSHLVYSQLYQGPENGSVPSGVIVNTENFLDLSGEQISPYVKRPPRNREQVQPYPNYMNRVQPAGPEGSNIISDGTVNGREESDSNPLVIKSYQGFLDPGNYIPPDNHIAVGPNHVMIVDNGRFRIWDKSGTLIKNIFADTWFSTALGGVNAFDPKVNYDHFNKRWIMVWLDQNDPPNERGYYLISVSDDSNPVGTWYNWAIKSSLNGSTESGTWSDYQGVGFDGQALYITGRQFGFYGGFYGCKFRIIGKTNLYANNAGQLTWTDFWEIRDPSNLNIRPDGIRPTIIYGNPSEYYFFGHGPFVSNTYVILYKLINPLNNPTITGFTIPVVTYSSPPNANQLGGGSLPIEGGGQAIRNEPTYRNGFLWATHAVSSGTGYSNINYMKINVSTNTAVEDYAFGASGLYHFYPAIGVDQNMNILLSFSRSGDNEYAGAFYNSRLNSDPQGSFNGTRPLQPGKANYVKDFSSGRNRWGDYNGVWLDPSDQNNFWVITEYAEFPPNTWACQVGNIRLIPFSGARVFASKDSLDFGVREVTTSSDTLSLTVYNFGSDTLRISNFQTLNSQFVITSPFNYPVNISFQDSVIVKMLFRPNAAGVTRDSLRISSNDNLNPVKKIPLKGKGYIINPVSAGVMYGVTGTQEGGTFITINTANGTGTTVGPTGYSQLTGISIRPSTGQMYGTSAGASSTTLVRVNAAAGDAYPVSTIPLGNVRALTFDLNDILYAASTDGRIFKINISSGDTDLVGSTNVTNLYGLSLNPVNGQLWGISVSNSVYKINKTNGSATLVGTVGQSITPDLSFDISGNLYCVSGIGNTISSFYKLDTTNASGTLIGPTGKKGINSIASAIAPIGIQPVSGAVPVRFGLYQNYPNPFNPVTKIKFDIPRATLVKIKVYDILGREVITLVDKKMEPGSYEVTWLAADRPSGIYFYRIQAAEFTSSRKMVIVK